MRDFDNVKPEDREKKLYFNKHEFIKLSEQSKKDPFGAIEGYQKYLEKYPDDNSARTYYASNLIAIGRFKEADRRIYLDYSNI